MTVELAAVAQSRSGFRLGTYPVVVGSATIAAGVATDEPGSDGARLTCAGGTSLANGRRLLLTRILCRDLTLRCGICERFLPLIVITKACIVEPAPREGG